MRISLSILPIAAAGLLFSACGTTTTERVATGALGGAAVGAVVDGGTGALIGGAAGAVGGAVVDQSQKDRGR
ncbi:MAG TPA: YMGG-like glycine zipper-containing protein [Caulobacteraceae bacterium]|jgi:hypothetical protein|nr:YMGG-like glycine zipper-containing protein [Caulobacteraceae bacterium]